MQTLVAGAGALGLTLTQEQTERFRAYLASLTAWNERANLTSPSALADAERVHFLDSLTIAPLLIDEGLSEGRLIDVGSGAGFPGLVLKVALPTLSVVLLEATRKKADFLRWIAQELGLEDVQVIDARAEEAGHWPSLRERFDAATARALGPLPVVAELTLPYLRPRGLLIAPRGREAAEEAKAATTALGSLGGELRSIEPVRLEELGERALVVVEKTASTPDGFPRRIGVPAKRPLSS